MSSIRRDVSIALYARFQSLLLLYYLWGKILNRTHMQKGDHAQHHIEKNIVIRACALCMRRLATSIWLCDWVIFHMHASLCIMFLVKMSGTLQSTLPVNSWSVDGHRITTLPLFLGLVAASRHYTCCLKLCHLCRLEVHH